MARLGFQDLLVCAKGLAMTTTSEETENIMENLWDGVDEDEPDCLRDEK